MQRDTKRLWTYTNFLMKTETKTAIVTGASSGIGLGITQALLERGWHVVATSRAISKSEDLKPSPDLVLVDGDAGHKETAVKVVDVALKHFGRTDLLVNNRVDGGVHAGR